MAVPLTKVGTPSANEAANGAIFDASGRFRYLLWRTWAPGLPRACFVMLNPSTADAIEDDPTIRRCTGFASAHGFGGLDVVNLFAYRARHPDLLPRTFEARGEGNETHIRRSIERCAVTIAAWGVHGSEHWQAVSALEGIGLQCLGVTKDDDPRHPLYVRGDVRLRPWRTISGACHPTGT